MTVLCVDLMPLKSKGLVFAICFGPEINVNHTFVKDVTQNVMDALGQTLVNA